MLQTCVFQQRVDSSRASRQVDCVQILIRFLLLAAGLLLLAACGSSSPRRPSPDARTAPASLAAMGTANDVLFRAIALVGTPYHFGGNTPVGGFDCSGLVNYVFRDAAGISLPRTSAQMSELHATKVDRRALRSGDLVFFRAHRRISHVGIYVGENRFVHAPNSGGTVRLDNLDGAWWRKHFAFGKRIIH